MPADGAPELAAPAGQPAQGSASRAGRDGADAGVDDQGPLLGLSDSDIVRSDGASTVDSQPELPAISVSGSSFDPAATAAAPSAPPRRRIFGNLFSSLGSNWIRR
jgi:hypothetical protein